MTSNPLSTQCPQCQQVLDVTLHQLAQARGRAVCGHCHASFDALARLALNAAGLPGPRKPYPVSNELPLLNSQPAPIRTEPAIPARPDVAPRAGETIQDPVTAGPVAASALLLRQPAVSEEAPARTFVPDFVRQSGSAARRRWRHLAIGAAALLLLAFGAWGLRRPLTRLPLTGPGMAWLCSVSGCRLPILRDSRRLQLLARDVRANPQHPGQLAINLSLRNNAWFTQPYPIVNVQLQGRDGHPLASRDFRPETYLGHVPRPDQGLQPAAELTISLQMDDPGTAASSFGLHFR
ncbi:zinc-ribbon and DUF3426 domain-containing protein [Frateuria aurantia]|uniref:Zinc finger/thioredoxin putative domain-containing protein n=1 Tax=Frateuria aurantia (strain ATCC 33424 / DSM 6220 / KCTC 2777 / LMG 1558 / NBRC 3245 / NCIMB 13370) TaxID=767434 RepID=H8L215_FRAAD|nr:zinc-ribbon and DUF3426 domain-containing protein [Frateuria aurantia]AFC87270.1 Protein of unknown function (DUF3426) [Frateuria aurantia DSM 6220]